MTQRKKWYQRKKIKEQFWKLAPIIISIVMPLGVGYYQENSNRHNESTQNMTDFVNKLNEGTNKQIVESCENNAPILTSSGGKLTENDLDNFLGIFQQLEIMYKNNTISQEALKNIFSNIITKCSRNLEIRKYLTKIRKEDPCYFLGFDKLVVGLQSKLYGGFYENEIDRCARQTNTD